MALSKAGSLHLSFEPPVSTGSIFFPLQLQTSLYWVSFLGFLFGLSLLFFFLIMYICMFGFTHVSAVLMEARRGHQNLELQAAVGCLNGNWQVYSGLLEEWSVCLTSESFFQLWFECFETGSF